MPKRVLVTTLFFVSIILVISVLFSSFFIFNPEQVNLDFYKQIHVVASELKAYKAKHGMYPETVLVIRTTDEICLPNILKTCKRLYYKPSADLQDFRMAMPTYLGAVLFYHPEVSFSIDDYYRIPKSEQERMYNKFHYMCFTCIAHKGSVIDLFTHGLIYRETPPIFSNPSDWPIFD